MENNYISTEQEALSVIIAAEKCQPYLLGSHFVITANHEAVRWLMQWKKPKGLLARWTLNLKSHEFGIKYRLGKKHGNADALSRRLYTRAENSMPQKNDNVKKMQSQDDDLANLTSYTFGIQKQSIQNIEMENQFVLDTNGLLIRQVSFNLLYQRTSEMNYWNDFMTTFLVPTMKLTEPMKEWDLRFTCIRCLLIYKGGFVHAFYAHKRNKIIITIRIYY